ncbi:MAG: M36 family metallopeptidase [Weeksellaceae bacterium]
MKNAILKLLIFMLGTNFCFAQQKVVEPSEIYDFMRNSGREVNLSDLESLEKTDAFQSENSDISYNYFKQTYNCIPIYNSHISVVIKNGEVKSVQGNIIDGLNQVSHKNSVGISANQIAEIATNALGFDLMHMEENQNVIPEKFANSNWAQPKKQHEPQLVYFLTNSNQLVLSYQLIVHVKTDEGQKVLLLIADASTGEVLHKHNLLLKCDFSHGAFSNPDREIRKTLQESDKTLAHEQQLSVDETPQYRVFAFPNESPVDSERELLMAPHFPEYSPAGWHSDGETENFYTFTVGNNVAVMYDHDSHKLIEVMNGFYPSLGDFIDGGSTFNFDFPLDLSVHPNENKEANISHLFYSSNLLHDIFYRYGFDEASANLQGYNFTGEGLGEDGFYVLGQTGESIGEMDNAYCLVWPEGESGVMLFYLFTPAVAGAPVYDLLEITTEGDLQGLYVGGFAEYGPILPTPPLLADLRIMEDTNTVGNDTYDGCDAATNSGEINGKIAVVRRGNCDFVQKTLNAQNAGALAVVVVNNVPGEIGPETFGMAGYGDEGFEISSIIISKEDGDPIISALENGTLQASIPPQDFVYPDLVRRDSSIDNGIIAHEYGHAVSARLSGGGFTYCLDNLEQMGEGWSDYFALMLTMQPGDQGTDARGLVNFLIYRDEDGQGLRPTAYSTDMMINPSTYASLSTYTNEESPHRLGYVWATMLWEMNWNLIEKYGFNPDIMATEGGNNKALQLVTEALKVQACQPGFVDGRDAILTADELLYDGENQCEIWKAFSKRGLGYYADQGDTNDRLDGTPNFDMPPTEVLDCSQMSVSDMPKKIARIYPNPTSGIIHIMTKESFDKISVSLMDIAGRIIQTNKISMNGNTASIDISDQPKGVYVLKIATANGENQSFKVIKK